MAIRTIAVWLVAALATAHGQALLELVRADSPTHAVREVDVLAESQPTILQQVIEHILQVVIPREYENTKKWGTTKEVFDGVHVRSDGLKISTKRKKKQVKHGTWKRYRIALVDPNDTLQVRLRDPKRLESGIWSTEIVLAARLDVSARLQEWQRDVRLMSVSAQAKADVELTIKATIATELDPASLTPTVVFRPHVQSAELKLTSFKLERVSNASGFVVRELVGDGMEPLLDDMIRDKNDELVEKLNRQIEKHQDKLRLSTVDPVNQLFRRWFPDESP